MNFETWLLFTVTETALCLTPGPAVLLVLSVGLSRGAIPSIAANLGILTANTMYFLLSAAGLATILLASYEVFFLIKWIGAAYLLYLGIQAFRSKAPALAGRPDRAPRQAISRTFAHGFVLQAANLKSILFFGALLPQFVDPAQPLVLQIAILGVTSVAIAFIVLIGYGAGRPSAALYRLSVVRALEQPGRRRPVDRRGRRAGDAQARGLAISASEARP